jgi:hypothetical protein
MDLTELSMLSSRTGIESEIVGSTSFLLSHSSSNLQMLFVLALPREAKCGIFEMIDITNRQVKENSE